MKRPLLCSALLLAGLFAACNSGNPASETTAETTALTDTTAARPALAPPGDCMGKERPPICVDSCGSVACEDTVLKQHGIPNLTGYVKDGGAFKYTSLELDNIFQEANCTSNFIFAIHKVGSSWYSNIFLDSTEHTYARSFPVPLIKGIRRKHGTDMAAVDFYWLKKSPQCPNGNDVLMDVVMKNNTHAYYDISQPPTILTAKEAEALRLLNKSVPQTLPKATGR